jgi:hypothetical protein
VDLLRRVVETSRNEGLFPVPAELARNAAAIFERRQGCRGFDLPRIVARLVYDSFQSPAPAGVRSVAASTREILYRARDYRIDLRLDSDPAQGQWSVAGQIADQAQPQRDFGGVPVFLTSRKKVIAFTRTNQFGEFQIEYPYQRDLRLSIPLNAVGKRIEIPIRAVLDSSDGDDS